MNISYRPTASLVKDFLRDCRVAEKAGCQRLLSEDLNPGQIYGTIPAVNPFAK